MRQVEFLFNIPAEHLTTGANDEFITVKVKEVFVNMNRVDIIDMPAHLLDQTVDNTSLVRKINDAAKHHISIAPDVTEQYIRCV